MFRNNEKVIFKVLILMFKQLEALFVEGWLLVSFLCKNKNIFYPLVSLFINVNKNRIYFYNKSVSLASLLLLFEGLER